MVAAQDAPAVLKALLPVLVQIFGVIVLGYLAGKTRTFNESQARGLGIYVTKFALPAIFFKVMVNMEFSGVNWYIILAVSLGKLVIFLAAFFITIFLTRNIGMAAILAMCTSQSNDVALAYPILRLLSPQLADYIYLFAPTQLLFLNPIGYFALEWHSACEADNHSRCLAHHWRFVCQRIFKVVLQVIINPLFVMTVIGTAFSFILSHKLPAFISGFFEILGDSFGAGALFFLGMSMVGRLNSVNTQGIYILTSTIIGKMLILPIISRELASSMLHSEDSNATDVRSTFVYLYASAPTAPPVFLFAYQYGIIPDIIGACLVLETFLFAPIIALFMWVIMAVKMSPIQYQELLKQLAIWLSLASVISSVCTLIIYIITKKIFKFPYRYIAYLLIAILLYCISFISWYLFQKFTQSHEVETVFFIIYMTGRCSAYIWIVILCVDLLLASIHHTQHYDIIFHLLGWLLPLLVTIIFLVGLRLWSHYNYTPLLQHSSFKVIMSVLLTVCMFISVGCLVFSSRNKNLHNLESINAMSLDSQIYDAVIPSSSELSIQLSESEESDERLLAQGQYSTPLLHDEGNCTSSNPDSNHVLFIITLILSMFLSLCVLFWRLHHELQTGVIIILEVFDVILVYGGGLMIFICFGFEKSSIFKMTARIFSWIWKVGSFLFAKIVSFSADTDDCISIQLFVASHLQACKLDIGKSLILPENCLDDVFTVEDINDWLKEMDLSTCHRTSFALLMELERCGQVKHLNNVPCEAAFETKCHMEGYKVRLTSLQRVCLFQFTSNPYVHLTS